MRSDYSKPEANSAEEGIRAKRETLGRRPEVKREATSYSARRLNKAVRYEKGIEAASLFELKKGIVQQEKPVSKVLLGVMKKNKHIFVTACVIFAAAIATLIGVNAAGRVYTSNETFISDVTETGNITIADRLTTSEEMAEKLTYVLIVGVDAEEWNTDCLWLVCYDIEGNAVNVMQMPRDTFVGDNMKINSVYSRPKTVRWCETCGYSPASSERSGGKHTVCGTELTYKKESKISGLIRFINEHLGMPIDHFVIFTFQGFSNIVDEMGGVEITLEKGISDKDITLPAGTQTLTGNQAMHYMRHRKGYADGDLGRVKAQRLFINAMLEEVLDMDVSQMLALITKSQEWIQTDLSLQEIKNYALKARSLRTDNLNMFTMAGEDRWAEPRKLNPSFFICDSEGTRKLLNENMLPYGLPGGGYLEPGDVFFPTDVKVIGEATDTGGKDHEDEGTTRTTAEKTTSTSETTEPTSQRTTESTKPTTEPSTQKTTGSTKPTTEPSTQKTTESTKPTTEPSTQKTTESTKPTTEPTTEKPTDPPTQPPTEKPTDPPTQPPTQPPASPEEPSSEAVG